MLDPVPLAGAGWQVGDHDPQPCLIGKALEFALPQLHLRPVAAATVGGDRQPRCIWIARLAKLVPPAPDALDGEGARVGADADTDRAVVRGNVIDAPGSSLGQA